MNQLKTILLIFIVCLYAQSCRQNQTTDNSYNRANDTSQIQYVFKTKKANTHITGNIENASRKFVILTQNEFNDTALLDKSGFFQFNLYLDEAEYFLLRDGKSNIRLFVEQNNKINIKYDADNTFKTIAFTGNGKDANIYLKDKYLLSLDYALPIEHLYDMPAKTFKYQVDSIYVISKMFFDKMAEKYEFPSVFKKTELATLQFDRATKILEYLVNSRIQKTFREQFLASISELSVNEESYLSIYEYRSFLAAYIYLKSADKIMGKNLTANEITLIKMQTINLEISNQKVKDYLLYTNIKQFVKYYGYKNSDLLFKTFEANCRNSVFLKTALNSYKNYKELSEIKPAPIFKMENTNGNSLSLNDFKRSYIYIDVWASWCLPCRREAPIFERLREDYKHKNIIFISLSIDKTKSEWLEYLNAKNINKQDHYWVTATKRFLDLYMIKTIPHFLIIDDKGNLIDNNASRPSEGKTEWLDKLPDKPEA